MAGLYGDGIPAFWQVFGYCYLHGITHRKFPIRNRIDPMGISLTKKFHHSYKLSYKVQLKLLNFTAVYYV